ncbi:phospho-N-acetylmuramoyl-pentapeptide-transferase [Oscillochloris trichoides DG-6]|uniref:Phospho-N-acetylmuramoyl-pentapeptide-transferase n=1 Tax=Oscillochloris trichoides DG-6 TaxID=765420 RepID=E1IHH6_9CHLR|nr:phospho-N-acetylmuramoyl-pentapeptide-transferase [Oscillochloris trichoides DG-6]
MLVQDMARALLLAAAAFVLTLFVGAWWVRFARQHKLGKQIRLDGPQSHLTKMGTPTMGGVMIVSTVLVLTVLFNLVDRWSMLLPLAVMVSFAVLGGLDDWLTLTKSQSKTYGFTVRYKFLLMLAIAFIASLALYLPKPFGLEHDGLVQIPFVGERNIGVWFIPIATLFIVFISNAVNITDGLDSLAGWNLTMAFGAYGVMTFLAEPRLTNLMALCFTLVGACAAFLWYNAHPAQVFMGDLGSLALGAVLAVVALQSQQWLLLPVVGIIFVVEAFSTLIQTGYFKWTKRRYGEGRRIFKMAPLHHHFELLGWSQVQVTQRFVLIGTVAAMVGISLAITFARPSPGTERAGTPPTVMVEQAGE